MKLKKKEAGNGSSWVLNCCSFRKDSKHFIVLVPCKHSGSTQKHKHKNTFIIRKNGSLGLAEWPPMNVFKINQMEESLTYFCTNSSFPLYDFKMQPNNHLGPLNFSICGMLSFYHSLSLSLSLSHSLSLSLFLAQVIILKH